MYGKDPATVMGFDTDACVLATCFNLFEAGINFQVDTRGCASADPDLHDAAVSIMQRNFGNVAI